MRKAILTVAGIAGLALLLCGSGELLAQSDATNAGSTAGASDMDSRVQGLPSDVNVEVGDTEVSDSPETPDGTSSTGNASASDAPSAPSPSVPYDAANAANAPVGTPVQESLVTDVEQAQAVGGTSSDQAGLQQTVLDLQQQLAQVQQDVEQLRGQVDSLNASMGVGGAGQADTGAAGTPAEAAPNQNQNQNQNPASAANGATAQGAVAAATPANPPPRAGTAQETGAASPSSPDTSAAGSAVVDAIYTGKVKSVSNGKLVLLVDDGKPFPVELGQHTRVFRGREVITAQELKPGTLVRVTVDLLSGHELAKEVRTVYSQ